MAIHEVTEVTGIDAASEEVETEAGRSTIDRLVNAAGLLGHSLIAALVQTSSSRFDLAHSSHLGLSGHIAKVSVLQVFGECRIIFAPPHGEYARLGTTEVHHAVPDTQGAATTEVYYLQVVNKHFFEGRVGTDVVLDADIGMSPIVASSRDRRSAGNRSLSDRASAH